MRIISSTLCVLVVALTVRAGDAPATEQEYFATRTVQLCYDVESGGDPSQTHVELWTTRDGGKEWARFDGAKAGTTPDGQACLTFELPEDGEYGLKTVATDDAGNADARPTAGEAPLLVAVIDTSAPAVEIKAPEPGSWAQTGSRLSVRWTSQEENATRDGTEIDTSVDGGGSWTVAASGLPAEGERLIDLPGAETPDFRVRVSTRDRAGNEGSAALPRGVVVRRTRPPGEPERFTSAAMPPSRSACLDFGIEYAIDDIGPLGLQSIVLWWTSDGGATWQVFGTTHDHSTPFPFHAPKDGTYGFVLQAIDNAHRPSVPDPAPGTAPQRITIVDTDPPKVTLLAPAEGALVGGTPCEVKWTASDDSFDAAPISILWSLDGGATWTPIATSIANGGAFAWTVPQETSSRARVKVVAVDQGGNCATAESRDLALVSGGGEPPRVRILGVKPLGDVRVHPPAPSGPLPGTPATAPSVPVPPGPRASTPPDKKKAGALYDRGRLLRAQGKREEARDAFRAALEADPGCLAAANDLGCVLSDLEDAAGAAEAFARARDIDPCDPEVRYNLAGALLSKGSPAEALAEARAALKDLPKADALAAGVTGLVWKISLKALERNDLSTAREAWKSILSVDAESNRWRDSANEMLQHYGE